VKHFWRICLTITPEHQDYHHIKGTIITVAILANLVTNVTIVINITTANIRRVVTLVTKAAMVIIVTKVVINEYTSSCKAVVSKGVPQNFEFYTWATRYWILFFPPHRE
jgi:hypothetical protein